MERINVDFNGNHGKMKRLHGINNAPVSWISDNFLNKLIGELNIPFVRPHDARVGCDVNIADISAMFPDFSKDPADPENYDFAATDLYIKKIVNAGSTVFFRLGQSIEWGPVKKHIAPPKDFLKWAKICEYVIRHYNEGWADGFHYGFKYWEIWNEPEMSESMWLGTKEEYYRLYDVATKHLKECFPELKFGGYASCGFAEITRDDLNEHDKRLLPFFYDFLEYVKKNNIPFDFFSWHIYSLNTDEIITHAEYARKALDKAGYQNVETYLTEWNHISKDVRLGMEAACYVAGTLCGLQCGGNLDGAMYYQAGMTGYNGLYNIVTYKPERSYYAIKAFSKLYKLGTFVFPTVEGNGIYCCAAKNENEKSVMIVNSKKEQSEITIELKNLADKNEVEFYLLDDEHDLEVIRKDSFKSCEFSTTVTIMPETILLMKIK